MRRIRRPSPSLVVACLALAIALSGSAVAASVALAPNSVGTPQLRNNAVTTAKVRNGSLLRADFKRNQIPAGPRRPCRRGRRGWPGWSRRPQRRLLPLPRRTDRDSRYRHDDREPHDPSGRKIRDQLEGDHLRRSGRERPLPHRRGDGPGRLARQRNPDDALELPDTRVRSSRELSTSAARQGERRRSPRSGSSRSASRT